MLKLKYSVTCKNISLFIQKLQDLDDDLKEKYLELITRFYLLFENIYQYIVDLNSFVEHLNDGVFIQQNIETVMRDVEGKQLLVSLNEIPCKFRECIECMFSHKVDETLHHHTVYCPLIGTQNSIPDRPKPQQLDMNTVNLGSDYQ